jgi:hypothetical protein
MVLHRLGEVEKSAGWYHKAKQKTAKQKTAEQKNTSCTRILRDPQR